MTAQVHNKGHNLRADVSEAVATFTILVTGDRNWTSDKVIDQALDEVTRGLNREVKIVVRQGGAVGADSCSAVAAWKRGWIIETEFPDWARYGRAAGPIRNQTMLEMKPPVDVILAFHDDLSQSKGTKDMVNRCLKAGRQVNLFNSSGQVTRLRPTEEGIKVRKAA